MVGCRFRRVRAFCAFVFLSFIVSGCSTRLPSPWELKDTGHLLIGLGTNKFDELQALEIDIVKSGVLPGIGTKTGTIRLCKSISIQTCDKPEYGGDESLGLTVARRMPPGKYIIKSVWAVVLEPRGGYGNINLGPDTNLDISFEIKPGVTTSLGRYWLNNLVGLNQKSTYKGRHAEFLVEDRLQADLAIARVKMPHLFNPIEKYLPAVDAKQAMSRLSNQNRFAPYTEVRSERLTDGQEDTGCSWWC